MNNQYNQNYTDNAPRKKKSKVIIIVIAVLIAVLAAAGIIIWKIVSEKADEERNKKPYRGSGYIMKAKISAADSTADYVKRAFASALMDLEEQDYDLSYSGIIEIDESWGDANYPMTNEKILTQENAKMLMQKNVQDYFSGISKVKDGVVFIEDGSCIGVICTTDGEYWGTYPRFALTVDDYRNADEKFTYEDVGAAMGEKHPEINQYPRTID